MGRLPVSESRFGRHWMEGALVGCICWKTNNCATFELTDNERLSINVQISTG